tara:strand:+ start:985 stop:1152 length:168 start_codon:yes stop_codon:yes gene_type:complete
VLDGATTGVEYGFVRVTIKADMDVLAAPNLGVKEVGVLTILIVPGRRRSPVSSRH